MFLVLKPCISFLITQVTSVCMGVSHQGTSPLAAGIHTKLSLLGTDLWLEVVQEDFFQSKFKDTNCTYRASYAHMCTIMFQIWVKQRSDVNRKVKG